MKIILSHGRALGATSKDMAYMGRTARAQGFSTLAVDDRGNDDRHSRRARLADIVAAEPEPVLLAGFSMGAYISAQIAAEQPEQVRGLFLLAPPFYHPRYGHEPPRPPQPMTIMHGWQDEVVPWQDSVKYCTGQQQLILVPAPHFFGSPVALALLQNHFATFLKEYAWN